MPRPIPGFRLTLGITTTWLSLIVLVPLAGLFLKASTLPFSRIWEILSAPRTLAAFRVSFGCAAASAVVNGIAGPVVAWTLVRYKLPGHRFLDALIDIPFALPTAVAGITLTTLYGPNGWVGGLLDPLGIKVSYTLTGITIALVFVGLPFVIRTVQPVLEEFPAEAEEAAALLGATRLQTILRVILPSLIPAILTGALRTVQNLPHRTFAPASTRGSILPDCPRQSPSVKFPPQASHQEDQVLSANPRRHQNLVAPEPNPPG